MLKGLKRFAHQFKYGEKGFTLIELLVVVAILGVLAAVAIPNIAKFTTTGDKAAANTELAVVQTAQAAYMADNANAVGTQAQITPYSNKAAFTGTYTFGANGQLTAGTYIAGSTTFTLDVPTMLFK